jgi:hypothetical protein
MKMLIVVSLLASGVLGATLTPVAAQQAIGPSCLQIVEFAELVEFFVLPTGGGQLILTGKSLTYGDAYSGSGYLAGPDVNFTFFSGLLPGMLQGTIKIATGNGIGTVVYADNNQIQELTFKSSAPPCVLK